MTTFIADKVRVSGPKVDGSYTVTFDVGEYEQSKMAELVLIPQNESMTVKVDQDDR